MVANNEGVEKGHSWAKKLEEMRWEDDMLENMRGVPWEPIAGRGMIEIKSKTVIPGELEEGVSEEPLLKKVMPRRGKIPKYDVKKYGFTVGFPSGVHLVCSFTLWP